MPGLGNKEVMSKNIQNYMQKRGIDRTQLAQDLNVSYSTISDWINANIYPRIDKIELMARYFGVTKADLVEEKIEIDDKVRLLAAHINDDVTENQMEDILKYIDFIKSQNK